MPEEWRGADPEPNPVPEDKLENLGKVMVWLYGSKSDDVEPIINSQNPHIKQLGAVLQNSRARAVMLMRNNLTEAYAQVESKGARFEAALVNANQETENALSQITGFDPNDTTLLEIGQELAKNSERLFSSMTSMAQVTTSGKGKK